MDHQTEKQLHMGKLVKQKVKDKQLTPGKFGEMINTSRTNVYSIFSREEIRLDLLKLISKKLDYDFLQHISFQDKEMKKQPNISIVININLKDEDVDEFAKKTLDYFRTIKKMTDQE